MFEKTLVAVFLVIIGEDGNQPNPVANGVYFFPAGTQLPTVSVSFGWGNQNKSTSLKSEGNYQWGHIQGNKDSTDSSSDEERRREDDANAVALSSFIRG